MRIWIGTFFALLVMSIGTAAAYTVSPLRVALAPSGSEATQRITIINTEAQPITLSIDPLKMTIQPDGTMTSEPASGEMIAFPPRTVLAPNERQTVQVRYTGSPALSSGLYSIHVRQVPVNATQGQAQIKVATEFFIAAVVQPEGVSPDLRVTGIAPAANGSVSISVENAGNGMGRLSSGVWSAQTSAGQVELEHDALDFGDSAYILPGTTRTVTIKPEWGRELGLVEAVTFTSMS